MIGLANGCFDVLHAGHVALLETARRYCDRLLVALNADASVTRLKGPGRPVNFLADRARVVAALRCVDAVVAFDEDTPLDIIRSVRPDLLVKGSEYGADAIAGANLVLGWGGSVLRVAMVPGLSTTSILARGQPRPVVATPGEEP